MKRHIKYKQKKAWGDEDKWKLNILYGYKGIKSKAPNEWL
jgi:hypothetical protein